MFEAGTVYVGERGGWRRKDRVWPPLDQKCWYSYKPAKPTKANFTSVEVITGHAIIQSNE